MIAFLSRKYDQKQTTGHFALFNEDELIFDCKTLEPPWIGNQKKISCIPERKYKVVPHVSPKFGKCFLIKDIPNRDNVLFHQLNFRTDTEGCIGVGMEFRDINNDGDKDLINSAAAFDKLMSVAINVFDLIITSENPVPD